MSQIYTVKAGDTLSKIAALFGTTYQKIAADNGIANPDLIHPGQQLTINVDTVVYTVVAGDTLSQIAERFGTTYQKIAADNGIANPDLIRVGQKLTIR